MKILTSKDSREITVALHELYRIAKQTTDGDMFCEMTTYMSIIGVNCGVDVNEVIK